MLRLNLEALEILDAIARKGSFAAAAEEVHRVPSAVTYIIKKLEDEMGVQLFDRSGHRARLTPAGETLLEQGRHLLRAASDLEYRVKRVATGWEPELRIAIDTMVPFSVITPWIQAFDQCNSGTRLRFLHEALAGMWDALIDHRADLAIGVSMDTAHGSGFTNHDIGDVEFVFAVAPTHPLAQVPDPLPADLIQQYRVIAVADSSRSLVPRTVNILQGQETLTVHDARTKLQAQLAGLGCGYLPRCMIRQELAAGRLIEKTPAGPQHVPRFHAVWRNNQPGRALAWWIDRLRTDTRISDWLAGRLEC
ncbi:DNA-binding transcriptional LysR family regulator [Silvimonas terrae]|uniref:DNA-binding transcriptional LysR family regulator n=1 Tax=Silvimonas terrae TaxID=300266 RepID=A0A840RHT5_9NEIS|nr:LysR family transcriptional regulator [Silvimonas terrae]MBB5192895.1 DNA-binding transcriptional LysR family regulator [Silvimonas terrae]